MLEKLRMGGLRKNSYRIQLNGWKVSLHNPTKLRMGNYNSHSPTTSGCGVGLRNKGDTLGKTVKNREDTFRKLKDVEFTTPGERLMSFDVKTLFPSIPVKKAFLYLEESV